MPSNYVGLRAVLHQSMEDVADPFSDEGEHIVLMRFHATAQTILTDHLVGPQSVSDKFIEELIKCAFYGLFDKLRKETEGR